MSARILLVDDEKKIAEIVKMRLEASGYEVILAYDGAEAIEKVKTEKPDLVVLDLMLPKIDGYKVCRVLKYDEAYKKIPIIMFTARTLEYDKELGGKVGADAYVTKPFDAPVLLAEIERLLKRQEIINGLSEEKKEENSA
ncbi:MAG: response regulator [bacterium]